MILSKSLYARYKFFHEHAGFASPPGAVACALTLARAEERAEREGLNFVVEDDDLSWDGEGRAPKYLLWCAVYEAGKRRPGQQLASLGGVGVNTLSDPYLRVVAAELYAESFAHLDTERDQAATLAAAELAERATYAGSP